MSAVGLADAKSRHRHPLGESHEVSSSVGHQGESVWSGYTAAATWLETVEVIPDTAKGLPLEHVGCGTVSPSLPRLRCPSQADVIRKRHAGALLQRGWAHHVLETVAGRYTSLILGFRRQRDLRVWCPWVSQANKPSSSTFLN